jgi:hypothetical protein
MTCYDCEYCDVCPAADPDSEPWDERRYDCSWRLDWIEDDARREREAPE